MGFLLRMIKNVLKFVVVMGAHFNKSQDAIWCVIVLITVIEVLSDRLAWRGSSVMLRKQRRWFLVESQQEQIFPIQSEPEWALGSWVSHEAAGIARLPAGHIAFELV